MDETTKEFDLGELVGGNVASIVEKLPDLSDGDLAKLLALEAAAGNRTTLISAINQAVADRVKPKEEVKPAEPVKPEASAGDPPAKTYTQAEYDAGVKAAVANALKDKAAPKKTPVAKPIGMAGSGDGPALVALAGQSSIVFADADDVPIGALPKMAFGPGDYEPAGDRVKLIREIEFPTQLAETQISTAFILDEKGVASGKAELVMPFGVGGGRSSKLPPGTLSFAGAESYPAPAAA